MTADHLCLIEDQVYLSYTSPPFTSTCTQLILWLSVI